MMTTRKPLRQARRVLATVAAATMLSLSVGGVPTVLAKEPTAEDIARCERETTAYNSAWAASWAQANNQPASQAPPPPVPYVCGPVPDDPTPVEVPDTPDAPAINIPNLPERGDAPRVSAEPGKPGGGISNDTETPGDPLRNTGDRPNITPSSGSNTKDKGSNEKSLEPSIEIILEKFKESIQPATVEDVKNPPILESIPTPPALRTNLKAQGCDINKPGCARGNNDTSNSNCIGTVGRNCHKYKTEIEYLDGTPYVDWKTASGHCGVTSDNLGCSVTNSISNEWAMGATGGVSAEVASASISMTFSQVQELAISCTLPTKSKSRQMIVRPSRYTPRYSVAKYYEKGGGLAECSEPKKQKRLMDTSAKK